VFILIIIFILLHSDCRSKCR